MLTQTQKNSQNAAKSSPDSTNPLCNVEAEELILGGIMFDPRALPRIKDILSPEHFYIRQHCLIYESMLELHNSGRPTDIMMVSNRLEERGESEEIGGFSRLAYLLERTVSAANIDRYAEIVVEKWSERKTRDILSEELYEIEQGNRSVKDTREALLGQLETLEKSDKKTKMKLAVAMYHKATDIFEKLRLRGEICSKYRVSKADLEIMVREIEKNNTQQPQAIFKFTEFMNAGCDALNWLIPELLPVGEQLLLAAIAKTGKTMLAADLAYSILTGEPFIGIKPLRTGRVLLVTSDEPSNTTRRRLKQRGFDLILNADDKLRIMTRLDLSDTTLLEEQLKEFQPDLVIIDSLTSITNDLGLSEKDTEFARCCYRLNQLIAQYKSAAVLIHHENKDKEAKGINQVAGNSRIVAAFWGIWQLKQFSPPKDENSDEDTEPRRWLKIKPREGTGTSHLLSVNPRDMWADQGIFKYEYEFSDRNGDKRTQALMVLDLLATFYPKGLEFEEINQHLNFGRSLYTVLDRLEDRQLITKRRSLVNPRRWVYCSIEQDPPIDPPDFSVSNSQQSSESIDITSFEISQQLVNNNSTNLADDLRSSVEDSANNGANHKGNGHHQQNGIESQQNPDVNKIPDVDKMLNVQNPDVVTMEEVSDQVLTNILGGVKSDETVNSYSGNNKSDEAVNSYSGNNEPDAVGKAQDEAANSNGHQQPKRIDWVRYQGEIYTVSSITENGRLNLRKSGFNKICHVVKVSDVEIGGYK